MPARPPAGRPPAGRPLAGRLVERILRHGPLRYDAFVEALLYDEEAGFYASGRGAGRLGADFVTSPEIGPLFGELVARALDRSWHELGRPDPFLVVEAGAGRGVLARDVLAARPACAPALRYVLVERAEALRLRQHEVVELEPASDVLGPLGGSDPFDDPDDPGGDDPGAEAVLAVQAGLGPQVCALDRLPAVRARGMVVANELLDNLPFRVAQRIPEGWAEVRVGLDPAGRLVDLAVPAPDDLVAHLDAVLPRGLTVPPGARLPVQQEVGRFVRDACALLTEGQVLCVDYAATMAELVAREADDPGGWLRAYQGHRRVAGPLVAAGRTGATGPDAGVGVDGREVDGREVDGREVDGTADVTVDVVIEEFGRAARAAGARFEPVRSQAEWLGDLGIDERAAAAAAEWRERAPVGDLPALVARSRVSEAAALTDPSGLGAHRVLVARCGLRHPATGTPPP